MFDQFKSPSRVLNEAEETTGRFNFQLTIKVPTKVNMTFAAKPEGDKPAQAVALESLKKYLVSKYGEDVSFTVNETKEL